MQMLRGDGHGVTVAVVDAPVVSLGLPDAYPIPTNTTANMTLGAASLLYDNLWGGRGSRACAL